jgi:uncharacterized protein YcbX
MRTGITVRLNRTDRKRQLAIVDNRNSAQKQVWRSRIVLATADAEWAAVVSDAIAKAAALPNAEETIAAIMDVRGQLQASGPIP